MQDSGKAQSKIVDHLDMSGVPTQPSLAARGLASQDPQSPPQFQDTLVSWSCPNVNNTEVQQAFDPRKGYIYEVWIGCNGIGFSRSSDEGKTFSRSITVPGSEINGSNVSWDPAIGVSSNGTVYVAFMDETPAGDAPIVAYSHDFGLNFSGYTLVAQRNQIEFEDRDFIAVAPDGTVYVTWNLAPVSSLVHLACAKAGSCYFTAGDFNVVLASSKDAGLSWSSPGAINPDYPFGGAVSAPLLVEPSGQIDVLYEEYNVSSDHALGAGNNYFTTSSDGGRTWSPRVAVGGNRTLSPAEWWIDGSIARDAAGTLYASFDSNDSSFDTAWITLSRDDGRTWSSPMKLNPDVDSSLHIMAEVAGGDSGIAYVAWMSDNTTNGWSTYLQVLSDYGARLSSPIRISSQYGIRGYWVGDTIGISNLGQGSVAVSWGYGVNNQGVNASEVFVATIPTLANVTFTESGLPSGSLWNVTFDGKTKSSIDSAVEFAEVLGTYGWSVNPRILENSTTRYSASIASGSMNVEVQDAQVVSYELQYSVTLTSNDADKVTPNSTEWVSNGSSFALTARASSGFAFSDWISSSPRILIEDTNSPSTEAFVSGSGTIVAEFNPVFVTSSGTPIQVRVRGSISSSEISNMKLHQHTDGTYELTFTISTSSLGLANLTIPEVAVPNGYLPHVQIDGASATTQSFSQDSENYYVSFSCGGGISEVTIIFVHSGSQGFSTYYFVLVAILILAVSAGSMTKLRRERVSRNHR